MSVPFPNEKEKEFLEKYRKEINEKPAGDVFMLIDTKPINLIYSSKTRIFLAYCLFSKEKVEVDYSYPSLCSFIFKGMTVYSFIKNSNELQEDVLYGLIEKLELPEDLALKIYNNVLVWEENK